MSKKELKTLSVLMLCCWSCHQQLAYVEISLQTQQIPSLVKKSVDEFRESVNEFSLETASTVEYGEPGSLVNLYSDKVHSFLSSMQKVIDFGENAEGLNFTYPVHVLSSNQEVLQRIIEHPEYLESVIEVYPYRDPESALAEIRLVYIVPMHDGQYILGFLTSIGMVPETVFFLFSIENGIGKTPLRLTAVNGYRSQAVDRNQLQILNIEGSLAVSGGVDYEYDRENDYFYFLDGKISRAYSNLKYALVNGQLVLEEEITGVRQMNHEFLITNFVRQADQFISVSSIECSSPITFSDLQVDSSFADICERKEASEEQSM
ncbi:MAG: hypothetical protein AAGH78_11835 [Cyanobacteria bacterium P01_H01_bin.58]